MARKVKGRKSKRKLVRRESSRVKRAKRMERALIWGVIAVAVLLVGVLAYGFIYENVIKLRRPVAIVEGTPITVAQLQARIEYERMVISLRAQNLEQRRLMVDPDNPQAEMLLQYIESAKRELQVRWMMVETDAYEALIEGAVARHAAGAREGVEVGAEQVQEAVDSDLEQFQALMSPYSPPSSPITDTAVITPTPTPSVTRDDYLQALREVGVSEEMYRSWIEEQLLVNFFRQEVAETVPQQAEQVKVRYITLESEELANEIIDRLDAGEEMLTIAEELEADESITAYGNETEWYPRSRMELVLADLGPELVDWAFDLEVGEHTPPIANPDGTRYTVLEVAGHEQERELASATYESLVTAAFEEWMEGFDVQRFEYADLLPQQEQQ